MACGRQGLWTTVLSSGILDRKATLCHHCRINQVRNLLKFPPTLSKNAQSPSSPQHRVSSFTKASAYIVLYRTGIACLAAQKVHEKMWANNLKLWRHSRTKVYIFCPGWLKYDFITVSVLELAGCVHQRTGRL